MKDDYNEQKIKSRLSTTFEKKSYFNHTSILKSKLNTRKNFINEFLNAKKFKIFEDLEDSVKLFQQSQEIRDFSQLNILREIKIEDILNSLNNIKLKGIQEFLANLEQAKNLIVCLRKMICRNLNKNNSQLLIYGCDVILIDILIYYSENNLSELNENELIIILEIFWCLNNLFCIENSPIFKTIVDKNFVSILTFFLNLKNENITKELLSCLGNLVAENIKFRDYVLEHTILVKKLLSLSKRVDNSIGLIKTLIFTFRNFARGNPKASFEKISEIISIVSTYLWNKSEELIIDSIWTLSLLSDGPEEYQDKIASAAVIQKINEYSQIKIDQFQIPCLRILGNLLGGEISMTERLIGLGCFDSICNLAKDNFENLEILLEVFWCFLNLSKTNPKIINSMLNNETFFEIIKKTLECKKNKKIIQKTIKLLINLVNHGDAITVDKIINDGIYSILSNCLDRFLTDININKYLICLITHIIELNKLESILKEYIQNLAETYKIYDLSQFFFLFKTENKAKANGILNKYFVNLMINDELKKNLFEYYSFLDDKLKQKLMDDNAFEDHLLINNEFNAVKKIIECVKYSEILFDF